MPYKVTMHSFTKVDELEGSWTEDDYRVLLENYDYPDAGELKAGELREFLFLAIADFDPPDAAAILLEYKLSGYLERGQIDNLSHEMLREKVAENYSDIALHKDLFEVNQLLYKAFNGKFPSTQANVITFDIKPDHDEATEITKEIALKALCAGLKDSNLIHRLFEEPLQGKAAFPEAEHILWELKSMGNDRYKVITSEKWIEKEDFIGGEFDAKVHLFEDEEEE